VSGYPLTLNARDVDAVLRLAVEVEHPLPAFIQPYKRGTALDVRLDVERDTTIRRLLARGGPWWTDSGSPTRAHFKLAMLAYTPTEPKFLAWLDRVEPVPKSRISDGSALPDGQVDGPRD
jgi:hypothetical protein